MTANETDAMKIGRKQITKRGGKKRELLTSWSLMPWWRWTPSRKSNSWGESRTKPVIDETMFHSLDCARGRVSLGADTHCTASHQYLITTALTSINRLWNIEKAHTHLCEAIGGALMNLRLLGLSWNITTTTLYGFHLTPVTKHRSCPPLSKISMMSILRSSVSSRGSKRCRGGAVGMHDSRLTLACLWQQKADLPVSPSLIIPNNNQCWRTLNGKSGPAFLKVNAKFALPLCSNNNMCPQPANELPNSFLYFQLANISFWLNVERFPTSDFYQ